MSRPHQSQKEWQAKTLNKASNHLTVAERNRKWPWLWRKLSWDKHSEIKTSFTKSVTTSQRRVKMQVKKLHPDPKEAMLIPTLLGQNTPQPLFLLIHHHYHPIVNLLTRNCLVNIRESLWSQM